MENIGTFGSQKLTYFRQIEIRQTSDSDKTIFFEGVENERDIKQECEIN